MKKFCEFLREHAMKIIDFKKKKMSRKNYETKQKSRKNHTKMQKSVIFAKTNLKINI